MRYVHENEDGTVALWSVVPETVTRVSDGKVFKINAVSRNEERNVTMIRGGNNKESIVLVVGDKDFDIADLGVDSIPGYTVSFPTFEDGILNKLHPDHRAKIKKWRVGKKEEFNRDRTFRQAWRDKEGTVDVDVEAAKDVAKQIIQREANMMEAQLERQFARMQMEGGSTQQLEGLRKKFRNLKNKDKDPRINNAATHKELKQLIETILSEE